MAAFSLYHLRIKPFSLQPIRCQLLKQCVLSPFLSWPLQVLHLEKSFYNWSSLNWPSFCWRTFSLPPSLSLLPFFLFLLNWRGNASMQSPLSVLLGQSCPTLWDPMDPPGSSVLGILQTRILEWVAVSSSRDLPNPGIECTLLVSPALIAKFFTTEPPGSRYIIVLGFKNLFAP